MRCVFLIFLATPVMAEDFAMQAGDQALDAVAMQARVIGRTHEFHDGGQSFFSISGSFSYTYPDGGVAYGRWAWPENAETGVICTFFRHGFERCDMYVENNGRLLLIASDGHRFPVRHLR